ncbi:MAG: hypothetical protein ACYCPH_03110 [Minisyncoccota bacterium]
MRVAMPSAEDLSASRFGTRAWRVHFRGTALEVSRAPREQPAIPFAPEIDTFTMGDYGTQPTEALRVSNAWFLAYYHGEFGGALWQFNADGSVGRVLLGSPTYDLVRYRDEVLAATGSAAPFFFKPLLIHRFALRDGKWQEVGQTAFPYNIFDLTRIAGRLYGVAVLRYGVQTLAEVDLSAHMKPLWEIGGDLVVSNFAIARNGDIAIGARGYVIRLRRRGNVLRPTWYAPPDCVRYTAATNVTQALDARCIATAGTASYARRLFAPASGVTASPDGRWMLAQRGPHLLHFTQGRWHEIALPRRDVGFSAVDDPYGHPLLSAPGQIWMQRGGHWSQIGPSVECTTPFSISTDVAWCAALGRSESNITGIRFDGRTVVARVRAAQLRFVAAGLSGDAWFTIKDAPLIGHVAADGSVTEIRLSAPVALLAKSQRAVWFTETDQKHYGFFDLQNHLHELSSRTGYSVLDIIGAPHGAWLDESSPGEGVMLRQLRSDDKKDTGRYLTEVNKAVVTVDGTLYARSSKWPTIVRMTESGQVTRYRLPCPDPYLRLVPAPNDGLWFIGKDPHCSGRIEAGAVHVQNLPLVESMEYK